MPIEDLAKAALSTWEMDRLVEILIGRDIEPTADRLSSLHRFKNTINTLLPDIGEEVGNEILRTRPFKEAEALTELALMASKVPKEPIRFDFPLPVMANLKTTKQKGILKRKGSGKPKNRPYRPDGTKRGILSQYAGMRLYPVKGARPSSPGTLDALSLEIVTQNPGITYREFKEKGGQGRRLTREVKNKRIRVK